MGNFYNGGLWGKSLSFVGSTWNFVSGCIKNVHTHHESFSLEKQVIKTLTTKKPLTTLYEMNSNFNEQSEAQTLKWMKRSGVQLDYLSERSGAEHTNISEWRIVQLAYFSERSGA